MGSTKTSNSPKLDPHPGKVTCEATLKQRDKLLIYRQLLRSRSSCCFKSRPLKYNQPLVFDRCLNDTNIHWDPTWSMWFLVDNLHSASLQGQSNEAKDNRSSCKKTIEHFCFSCFPPTLQCQWSVTIGHLLYQALCQLQGPPCSFPKCIHLKLCKV